MVLSIFTYIRKANKLPHISDVSNFTTDVYVFTGSVAVQYVFDSFAKYYYCVHNLLATSPVLLE